jgi:hypothetical protein
MVLACQIKLGWIRNGPDRVVYFLGEFFGYAK